MSEAGSAMPLVLELDWVQPWSPEQLWTAVLWSLAAACETFLASGVLGRAGLPGLASHVLPGITMVSWRGSPRWWRGVLATGCASQQQFRLGFSCGNLPQELQFSTRQQVVILPHFFTQTPSVFTPNPKEGDRLQQQYQGTFPSGKWLGFSLQHQYHLLVCFAHS